MSKQLGHVVALLLCFRFGKRQEWALSDSIRTNESPARASVRLGRRYERIAGNLEALNAGPYRHVIAVAFVACDSVLEVTVRHGETAEPIDDIRYDWLQSKGRRRPAQKVAQTSLVMPLTSQGEPNTNPGGDVALTPPSLDNASNLNSANAAATTSAVQVRERQHPASHSRPDHSASTPPTPSTTGTPSEASSSSSRSTKPKKRLVPRDQVS